MKGSDRAVWWAPGGQPGSTHSSRKKKIDNIEIETKKEDKRKRQEESNQKKYSEFRTKREKAPRENLVETTVGTLRKGNVFSCFSLEYSGKQRYEHSWLRNKVEVIKYFLSVTVLPPHPWDSEQ